MAAASPHRFRAAETLLVDPFAVGALLPLYVTELRSVTRFLVAWDFGVGLYLILAFWMIAHSGVTEIHRQSLAQDEGGFAILVLTIVSACASVGAVFTWLEIATRAETFALPGLAFLLLTINAVVGVHPHHVRAPLRARILRRAS